MVNVLGCTKRSAVWGCCLGWRWHEFL